MPPKKSRPMKTSLKIKQSSKQQKIKKKRKRKNKFGYTTFSYSLLPKRKQLAKKVVAKLDSENKEYALARGINAIKLDNVKVNEIPTPEELQWRSAKKNTIEHKIWTEKKIAEIRKRELERRKRSAERREKELTRQKYMKHPLDRWRVYLRGYKKGRHRITKTRFMTCVDIALFQDALNANKDLQESPLWSEKLYLRNLSAEKVNLLKEHLFQFDVLVECLKQGIFDLPECDDFPIYKVRKRKKKASGAGKEQTRKKTPGKSRHRSNSIALGKKQKPRLSYPPVKASWEDLFDPNDEKPQGVIQGAINKVAKWIGDKSGPNNERRFSRISSKVFPKDNLLPTQQTEGNVPSSSTMMETTTEDEGDEEVANKRPTLPKTTGEFHWAKRTSLKSFPPILRQSMSMNNEVNESRESNEPSVCQFAHDLYNPYADLLTINVPTDRTRQKKFIKSLVEQKNSYSNKPKKKSIAETIKREEEEARRRHERVEKSDPLQRLHPDEKDSDILTITTTTTTDGYASWRHPRDLKNAGNKLDILAHKVDTSFAWRTILLLIIFWEIGSFVKSKLDDIYYWIFSSHLYRENIWVFEPTLFPSEPRFWVILLQEWMHFFISGISISIIHRQNECVSLLFAFSMLFDGVLDVLVSTHDYIYLPQPVGWTCVVLTSVHIVWKAFIICLFIGYHYYCAGYIRKAREFKLRKTKLHNHEIKAKGSKGLQKRRMAWSWMIRHARNTNLKRLKKKFPDIKDGNMCEDILGKEVKFGEIKELRLYTQKHSLNIGYPYNKLRDIKRYVFDRLEKSDYTDYDDITEYDDIKKKMSKIARRSTRAITLQKFKAWKIEKEKDEAYQEQLRKLRLSENKLANEGESRRTVNIRPTIQNLTITPDKKRSGLIRKNSRIF